MILPKGGGIIFIGESPLLFFLMFRLKRSNNPVYHSQEIFARFFSCLIKAFPIRNYKKNHSGIKGGAEFY